MAKSDYEKHILSDEIYTVSKNDGSKTRRFTDKDEADAYYEILEREEVQDRIASTNERILEILEGKKHSTDSSYDDVDSEYEKRKAKEAEQKRIANFKKFELVKFEKMILNGERNGIPWKDVALTTSNPTVIRILAGLNNKDIYLSLHSNDNLSTFKKNVYWEKYYNLKDIEEKGLLSHYADGCVCFIVGLILLTIIPLIGYAVLYVIFTVILGISISTVWIFIIGIYCLIYKIYLNYFQRHDRYDSGNSGCFWFIVMLCIIGGVIYMISNR